MYCKLSSATVSVATWFTDSGSEGELASFRENVLSHCEHGNVTPVALPRGAGAISCHLRLRVKLWRWRSVVKDEGKLSSGRVGSR